MLDPEEAQPWHRQPDETDRSFAAFCRYLDMGYKRTMEQLGREMYPSAVRKIGSTTTLRNWSAKYRWRERCRAFDDHQAQLKRDEEARLQQFDLDVLNDRRRVIREQAWLDCQRMREEILQRFNPPEGGKPPTTADIKNLSISMDKLDGVIGRLSKGLETVKPGQFDGALPPDLAAEFNAFLAMKVAQQLAGPTDEADTIPFPALAAE